MHDRFRKDYVVVMIDQDRMTSGAELAQELRKGNGGGIPWMVILDGEGKAKVTSDGPKGNVGCPARSHEIDYFLVMVDRTRSHMSAEDREILERELREYGAELVAGLGSGAGGRHYRDAVQSARYGQFTAAVGHLDKAFNAGYPAHRMLADPLLRTLRNDPDRRPELSSRLKAHVDTSHIQMVDPLEPGQRIRLCGRVVDKATGKPLARAVVHLFQTDAHGEYLPGLASGGGAGNPRLFGYVRSDQDGRFVVDTILPVRYPDSTIARHVHYNVWAMDHRKLTAECLFDSDENLTEKVRAWAAENDFPVVKLAVDAELRLAGELVVRVPPAK